MHKASMAAALAALLGATGGPGPARAEPQWQRIDTILLREGTDLPGGGRRFTFPRADLRVKVDGLEIQPALALGSWLAFAPVGGGSEAMVAGDLVLTPEEVAPVMRALFVGPGLEVTALHNHLLRSDPPVMYLHVSGRGDAVAPVPQAERQPEPDLDMAAIDRVLGQQGRAADDIYAVSVPRAEAIREHGVTVPARRHLRRDGRLRSGEIQQARTEMASGESPQRRVVRNYAEAECAAKLVG